MYSANIVGYQFDSEFGLYLPEYSVPSPVVQTSYRQIPGMDGAIDKTEQFGAIRYKTRSWKLKFKKTGRNVSSDDLFAIEQDLLNKVHGVSGQIIFDDDPEHYWSGRAFVKGVSCENDGMIIANIELTTDPYKYSFLENTISAPVSTSYEFVLHNGRKPVVPVVTTTDNVTLTFTVQGVQYTKALSAGSRKIVELVLFYGDTVVQAVGSGVVTFKYEDAHL